MAMSSVLDSPLDIYQTVCTLFPVARVSVVSLHPISLDVSLTGDATIHVRITSVVYREMFRMSLLEFKRGQPLNCEGCAITLPLANLRSFTQLQKERYENHGGVCLDVIVRYLGLPDPACPSDLMTLGLAPGQLTAEDATPYFIKIEKDHSALLPVLRARYSETVVQVQQQLCRQSLNQPSPQAQAVNDVCTTLRARVKGQEAALKRLASALVDNTPPSKGGKLQKPQAFLFVGPPGVGKSELGRAVGDMRGGKFIEFKMTEYMDSHSGTKLFGAPTGYVGSTDKPNFAKELEKCLDPLKTTSPSKGVIVVRNVVILFDEIEKAHQNVRQSLLHLLEIGEVTFSYTDESTRKNVQILYKLDNCIIVCTSNLFRQQILEGFRQGHDGKQIADHFVQLNNGAINQPFCFSAEWLSRITVTPFGPVSPEIFEEILQIKFKIFFHDYKIKYPFKEIFIENSPQFFHSLQLKLYDEGTDLRRIDKHLQDMASTITHSLMGWGSLVDKKVIFYAQDRTFWIKLHQFCIGSYTDITAYLPPISID